MKKFFVIFCLIIFFCSVAFNIYLWQVRNHVKMLENQVDYEIEKCQMYHLRDERRNCIMKTLILAYSLSTWEAYFYAVYFDDLAVFYDIPWEVLPALIRVESNFNPTIRSQAGCKGLMQIMESTGAAEAKKLHIRFKENESLWNEFINLPIGTSYLSRYIKARGVEGGIQTYLGGPDYLKSLKKNGESSIYLREYKTKVSKEYEQLRIMFRGIVDEIGTMDYERIYSSFQTDSSALILEIFKPDSVIDMLDLEIMEDSSN